MSEDAREFATKAGAEVMIYPPAVDPMPRFRLTLPDGTDITPYLIVNLAKVEHLRAIFRGRWPSLA